MCACDSRFHPQVPVSGVYLWLTYCHQCMSWRLSRSIYTQHGNETEVVEQAKDLEFGPFDSLEQVTAAGSAWLKALMLAPGRPWDSGGRTPETPGAGGD
jgi:hypothetical protein